MIGSVAKFDPYDRPPCMKCGIRKRAQGHRVCEVCLKRPRKPQWWGPEPAGKKRKKGKKGRKTSVDALDHRLPGSVGTGKRR
jgi:hypothetical protein